MLPKDLTGERGDVGLASDLAGDVALVGDLFWIMSPSFDDLRGGSSLLHGLCLSSSRVTLSNEVWGSAESSSIRCPCRGFGDIYGQR